MAVLPIIATAAVHAATSPACPKKTQMSNYGNPMPNPVLDSFDEMRDQITNPRCSWCNKPIQLVQGSWFHPETKSFTCMSRLDKLNRDTKPAKTIK